MRLLNQVCEIISNRELALNMYEIVLSGPRIAESAKPGQFVHLNIPGNSARLLRRPISIHLADPSKGLVHLVYQVVGDGTARLSRLSPGETIDCLGPLGNGFSLNGAERVFLVGGGCGIAPLRFVPAYWPDRKYFSFLGFKNSRAAYKTDEFAGFSFSLSLSSDDGSIGSKGLVTDSLRIRLEDTIPDIILACGPKPMLKAVYSLAAQHGVPCQISLEERMGCGIGGCLVCACAVKSGPGLDYKRVCADGPVFDSREVVFDD
jgi:dihydroorotate dehydrogenase electron transfer subunit